jgi:diguanylate cyclase (GGDEF)-like protein
MGQVKIVSGMPQLVTLTTPIDVLNDQAWPKRDANPKEARTLADQAKALSEASEYSLGLGRSFTVSSFLHYRAGRFAEGLEEALVALEPLELAQDSAWLSRLYNNLGLLHDGLGDRTQAMSWLLKQLELSQRLGDEQQEATALHDLGFLAINSEQGRNYFYKARELFYKVGDGWGVALSCMNMAEICTNHGDFEGALRLVYEAVSIDNHEGEAVEKAYISQSLGSIHAAQGKFEEALIHYHEALTFTQDNSGDLNLVPNIHLDIGKIYQKMGRFEEARSSLEKGLHLAEAMDFRVVIYKAHESLSLYYKELGEFEKAFKHFERFHALKEAIFNADNEQKMRAMEVIHRTETARQEAALQQRKNTELREHIDHLEKLNAQVKALSVSDPLTGLYNRRYLFDYLSELESAQPLSIAMFDIDHFKRINDTYTHFVGDDVLRGVGTLLGTFLRTTDMAARFGGEEFVIVFGHTSLDQAVLACERLRVSVETHVWSEKHPDLKTTISVGLSFGFAKDYETLLQTADKKLYEAKHLGRNCVVA